MGRKFFFREKCSLIAALIMVLFTVTSAGADLDVQVVKQGESGDVIFIKPVETTVENVPLAVTLIKGYSPSFQFWGDFNNPKDNVYDIFACGESQTTGQITCKAVNILNNTTFSTINFLNPSYNLSPGSIYMMDINGDGSYDALACGIKLADNSVVCQTRNIRTGAAIGVGQFTAIPASEGLSYYDGFRINTYVNTDGNWDTPEIGFCYKKAETQQYICRVVNPLTGALISSIPVLNANYDMYLWAPYFTDINEDGKHELLTCARNHTTGQFVCQIMNGSTGALIQNILLLSTSDTVVNYTYNNYDKISKVSEFIGCGWNLTTHQPKCQIRRQNNTIFKSINILDPSFIP